jgi:predicted HD phosphohydrolase
MSLPDTHGGPLPPARPTSLSWSIVDEALALVERMAGLPYLGEPVDQRAHALQSARPALDAGATDELVTAALLHDIARAPQVQQNYPGPHASAGADWCHTRFGGAVATLVGAHVEAKRWLVATDARYGATLSDASVRSLASQGGPMPSNEASTFADRSWASDAVALRRWDDAAKVPGGPEAAIAALRPVLFRVALRARTAM